MPISWLHHIPHALAVYASWPALPSAHATLATGRPATALPGPVFRRLDCTSFGWRLPKVGLGGLADVERDLIRTRTAEGRSRAKARGKHMGRPPALNPQQQAEARRRRAEGATLAELALSYNVSRATISRLGI
jgi:hypothetical protein